MNILVAIPKGKTRDTFIPPQVAAVIEEMGAVQWNEAEEDFTADEFREKLKGVEVCITGWGCRSLDKRVLENADRLKLVAHTGGSVAPLVSDYLYEKGVRVISGNWLYAESVAEGVIAYILASLRRIPYYNDRLHKGFWQEENDYNEGLLDQTVGLVGFGMTAKLLTNMLKLLRTAIKVYDPYVPDSTFTKYGVKKAGLEEIFSTSKVISLHAPRIPETFHMVGKKLLSMIPDGAVFINTSRGSVVNESELEEELAKNRFKAVLDVYETEPLPESSPLRTMENVILIPHMAGPTIDRRPVVTMHLLEDIRNFFEGRALMYEIPKEYASRMTR
jgi:phosphoglycerate dehydrogenase-like enzyme